MKLDFVTGTGRCGSSLVHEILAGHEHVGFISNLDDNLSSWRLKGTLNNRLYDLTRGAWTRKGTARFAPSEAYRLITSEVSPIYQNSCRDLLAGDVSPWLRQAFHSFFEARWRAQGRASFLHKYTGWSRIGFFAEIFPEARFVHVVRDGRAVANSWLQMKWWAGYRGPEHWHWGALPDNLQREWEDSGKSFVVLAGLSWRILIDSFQQAAAALGPGSYIEIRYEDFLASPRQTLESIVDFLGLKPSTRLQRMVDKIKFDSTRSRPFERELTAAQIAELERSIRPQLDKYGYA